MTVILAALACAAACGAGESARADAHASAAKPAPSGRTEVAILAGGCFWCTESAFDGLPGVIEAVSGYTGGDKPNPTYEQVSAGGTGHYESVEVRFDPTKITYAQILDVFWRQIDPTDAGGQFADRGDQYRAAIFCTDERQRKIAEASKSFLEKSGWFDKPIATQILPAKPFYRAEEYHQDYHDKHPAEFKAYEWGSGRGPFITTFWKGKPPIGPAADAKPVAWVKPSDAELRARLTPLQYEVTQHEATEPAFDNAYWNNHEPGIYVDVASGEPLFSSKDKYDSGTGWPSFSKPLETANIVERPLGAIAYEGAELKSRMGESHLGHVFPDGPKPTGMRYCIDSASLRFVPASELEAEGYGQYAGMFKGKAVGRETPAASDSAASR
jgi:peptide methionine sulfoxide reductase msrA/msrB